MADAGRIDRERLRAERRRVGMRQKDLAAKLDVATNYIGGIERGAYVPGLALVARMEKALGLEAGDLTPAGDDPIVARILEVLAGYTEAERARALATILEIGEGD